MKLFERSEDKSNISESNYDRIESCPENEYRTLMMTQMQIYRTHIKSHIKIHPRATAKEKSLAHFFDMFGKYFRIIYCGFACDNREKCDVLEIPFINIKKVFYFEQLISFPNDFSFGVMVKGCHYPRELNADVVDIRVLKIEMNTPRGSSCGHGIYLPVFTLQKLKRVISRASFFHIDIETDNAGPFTASDRKIGLWKLFCPGPDLFINS